MIYIQLRNKNRIVAAVVPGKAPIRACNSSAFFHNSMELVCITVGVCFGGELVRYCSANNVDLRVFESIVVTMDSFIPKIILSHPKNFPANQLDDIKYLAIGCQVAKMLRDGVRIEFLENLSAIETLIDDTKRGCCGG